MKKIIMLLYFQIYVDVLGFPVYYKLIQTEYQNKKRNFIDKYFFNKTTSVLFQSQLIKQHG